MQANCRKRRFNCAREITAAAPERHSFFIELDPASQRFLDIRFRSLANAVVPGLPTWVTPELLAYARRVICIEQNKLVSVAEVVLALQQARQRHGLQYVLLAPDETQHEAESPMEYRAIVEELRSRYGADAELRIYTVRSIA